MPSVLRSWIAALLAAAVVLAGLAGLDRVETDRHIQAERADTLRLLSTLRAQLEGELNGTLLLARGMASLVAVRGELTRDEFDGIAREIMMQKHHVRNVTFARGTVITFVYPLDGNAAALGKNYRDLPGQWPAVEKALRTGEPVLAGPVPLLQGGTAVIGRMPIMGRGGPWGMIAMPIMLPSLLEAAGLDQVRDRLAVAIRGRDGLGAAGEVFHGDPALFAHDPVLLEVTLPGGSWQLAGRPVPGWGAVRPDSLTVMRALGLALAAAAAAVAWALSRRLQERAEARRRVEESQGRLSAMLVAAPFPLMVLDRQDGRIQYANRRAGSLLGVAPEVLAGGLMPAGVIDRRDLARMRALLRRQGVVDDFAARLTAAHGRTVWVLVSMLPLDNQGPLLVACNDVTPLKEAERALQDQLALHQTVIETIPNAIFLKGVDGRHRGCNAAFERLMDCPKARLLDRTLEEIGADPELCRRAAETDRRLLAGEESLTVYETSVPHKDGSQTRALVHKALLLDAAGRPTGIVGAVTDISDRLAFEAQLRRAKDAAETASRAKSEFLAVISHEIRTPMNGILGMAHLLMETGLDAQQRDWLTTINSSGEALLTILNDILDFSRLEADRMAVASLPFDLRATLNGVLALMGARAREKGLELTLDLDPAVPNCLNGDVAGLRQVLMNLAGNAVKFTERGGISLGVFLTGHHDGLDHLRFEVRDTGCGIAPQALDRLFLPFSQADSSVTRRHGGAGLGLAICKRLVEAMGGAIGVDSEPGRGSRFWFTLALPPAPGATPLAPDRAAPTRPLTVLLAEDNAVNRKLAVSLLERAGHRVEAVEDGRAAVEAAARGGFDAVLMDVHMPEMDGLEATRRIRALPAPLGEVPIIALTANVLADDENICLDAGMTDYLGKPFKPAELMAKLARWTGPEVA